MTRRESVGNFMLMASVFAGGIAVGMAVDADADLLWGTVSLLLCVVAVILLARPAA